MRLVCNVLLEIGLTRAGSHARVDARTLARWKREERKPPGWQQIRPASLCRECLHLTEEAITCDHDRVSPGDRPREWLFPLIARCINEKRVPERIGFRWPRAWRLAVEECREIQQQLYPKQPTLIPVMHNPMIGQEFGGPLHSRVTRVHVEPHGIHFERGLRMPIQDLVLRPTGRGNTGRSSR